MRCILTGASGFIGRYLFEKLKARGDEVFAVSKNGSKKEGIPPTDLSIPNPPLPNDVDCVFNLAGYTKPFNSQEEYNYLLNSNVISVYNLLEFCRKNDISVFIHSSSASIYGRQTVVPIKESANKNPETIYALTKLWAENLCDHYNEVYGLKTISLRYFSVYGHGMQPGSVLPKMVHQAMSGKKITLWSNWARTQDFVYVSDVANANLAALSSKQIGAFNVGSGTEISMKNLAKTIQEVFHENNPKVQLTKKTDEISRAYADMSLAKEKLKYSPTFSLKTGLLDMKKHRAVG